jgi:SlyX protein
MIDNPNTITRVDALEMHIAHQNKAIDGLSEMSIKQWSEIKILNDKIKYLTNKLQELENGTNNSPVEEPAPPHF